MWNWECPTHVLLITTRAQLRQRSDNNWEKQGRKTWRSWHISVANKRNKDVLRNTLIFELLNPQVTWSKSLIPCLNTESLLCFQCGVLLCTITPLNFKKSCGMLEPADHSFRSSCRTCCYSTLTVNYPSQESHWSKGYYFNNQAPLSFRLHTWGSWLNALDTPHCAR